MFGQFTDIVSNASEWAYAIVFLVAFLDAIVPVVPSETAVITAGVVAAADDLSLAVILAAAASGAFLGDNTAYLIGHRFGVRAVNRPSRSETARKRIAWTQRQLEERGGEVIVVARFVPGGRTAVTLGAGTLRFPWRRFVVFDAVAASVWAAYASLLGYFGGRAFETAPWKGLIVALVTGAAFAGLNELVRWALKRWRRSHA